MPRGGFRPGAGAPRGNLNALKSGRYSAQMKAALHAMLTRDEIRPILVAIFEKRRRETLRYQALILATARIIHNAELTSSASSTNSLSNPAKPRDPGRARKKP